MHDLVKQQGCTILLVTHDNRILDIADRIIHMEDGKLVTATPQTVSRATLQPFEQTLSSSSLQSHTGRLLKSSLKSLTISPAKSPITPRVKQRSNR